MSQHPASPAPSPDESRLIWIDLEMTGLNPSVDRIIEAAVVVTDSQLEVVAHSEAYAIRQPREVLDAMDSWNTSTHTRSGLVERVLASKYSEADVERLLLDFVSSLVPANCSPMCGNSICQDRRFLVRYMPRLEQHFHYRNLDVSTLKELCRRWRPDIARGFSKKSDHTALADALLSIDELRYYRQHFLVGASGG
ncbi:MAG TPA: oligoribonuclease [Zeimonas sp.]|nr:oligoribonuclease [Zeimonas sp.]